MRKILTDLYYHSDFGRRVLHPLLLLRNNLLPSSLLLKLRFKRMLGYSLNLKNPKSYNEKLQWLKLNDRSELHILCADKYKVREYIEKKIGKEYLIPLLFQTKNVDEINIKNLPDSPFIIKTNHNSGGVYIYRNKNDIRIENLKKSLLKQLKYKYDTGKEEWHYQEIEPRVIIERLLIDENGRIPSDFKFHCFNGKVAFIQVDSDREKEHKQNFYNTDWEQLPFERKYGLGKPIDKPSSLNLMISLAEQLSKDFICVRVDFYLCEGKVYFGELTFYSGSGFGKFYPQEWDFKLGEMLSLPIKA